MNYKIKQIHKQYQEIIYYLFFGVLTTVVNYGTYFISTRVFQLQYLTATIIAWLIAVLFAFTTNKIFVFRNRQLKGTCKELLSFVSCRLLSGFVELLTMYLLVDTLKINDLIGKLLTNVIVVIMNYFFSKYFIFNKKNQI